METVAYAESSQCRRKLLLNYFGEDYPKDNCCMCDNCVNPKPTFDGRKEMSLAIQLIKSLPEHFKIEHLAMVLAGQSNAMIKSYHHDTIPLFGAGKPHGDKFWSAVLHQGLILHLLEKEIETYGLLYVTPKGEEFFADPYEIRLVEDRVFQGRGTDDEDDEDSVNEKAAMRGGGGDEALLSMLKSLRKDISKRLRLQPWIIFGDPALEDMSILYPVTYEELRNCQGVGDGKARKYGKEFIELIARYVEENDITRPEDFVVKSAPTKSQDKISIIQSIDRRMSLDDIAQSRGMEPDELLSEIESIVSSGTRLDINYYIDQEVDEDVVEDIYDYFKTEATSDSVEEAMETLGPDYEEREIRLVRIKFLCEIVN
jgi:ATP-dependent DNA helicase RecQ